MCSCSVFSAAFLMKHPVHLTNCNGHNLFGRGVVTSPVSETGQIKPVQWSLVSVMSD
jgi:hypothetical protein